jgi:hypothetical protein
MSTPGRAVLAAIHPVRNFDAWKAVVDTSHCANCSTGVEIYPAVFVGAEVEVGRPLSV